MPGYKSNAKNVLGPLINQLKGVETVLLDNITRTVAAGLVASNSFRIHNEGLAVNGTKIGDYKEGPYKKKRREKDKETQYVNLSFSGDLSKEFQLAASGKNTVGVGFLTNYGEELSEILEQKYNKKIWGVTQEDERIAQEVAKNKVNRYLNGKGA
jgi:hypothetical protein